MHVSLNVMLKGAHDALCVACRPSTQQPATHNETALVKDASISSSLLALIAQQEEENVAAEGQVLCCLSSLQMCSIPQMHSKCDVSAFDGSSIHAGKQRFSHGRE